MPRGDRTGPFGAGAMTGRAAGYCAGYDAPGFAHPLPARGFGMGFGRGGGFGYGPGGGGGRGHRHRFFATGMPGHARFGGHSPWYGNPTQVEKPDPEVEMQYLRQQEKALQAQLDAIRKHLSQVESGSQD